MVEFGSARLLGLLGSIFMVASIILPFLAIIGLILIVYSLYNLSKIYGDNSIFKNALYFIVLFLIGGAILFISSILITGTMLLIPAAISSPEELPSIFTSITLTLLFLIVAIISGVISIIGFYFFYKSLGKLSEVSGEGLFKTSGLTLLGGSIVLFIGLLTTIILIGILITLIGGLAILIGFILLAIAFYKLKPPQIQPPSTTVAT
ncbi:MAG: DUF996 domain-containing protein [Acidilobaceae archaeon]